MISILVVDDEETIRLSCGIFLTRAGFDARVAGDFDSAVRTLAEVPCQLVFTDLLLGSRSGMDLVRWTAANCPDTLAVVMTGQPSLETATESVRLGAYEYLAKPVTREVLLKTVSKALEHRALLLEKRSLEEALGMAEHRFRALFDNSIDGMSIYRVDPETEARELVDCNESYGKFSGRSREELLANARDIGKWRKNEFSDEERREVRCRIRENLPFSGTFSWIRPDGRENYMEFRAVSVNEKDGAYIYGIDREVTAEHSRTRRKPVAMVCPKCMTVLS